MYQFIKPRKISLISFKHRDLQILKSYGWKFVKYDGKFNPQIALKKNLITCVQFTKHACGIKKRFILTPDALFRYLNNK